MYKSKTTNLLRCLNRGEPPSKIQYYILSDSERVPRGKDEIEPEDGVKRNKIYIFKANKFFILLVLYLLYNGPAT